MKFFPPLVCLIIIFSCAKSESYPWLDTLDSETKYEESGKRLMSLDFGLNPLEGFNKNEKVLFIGVHGSRSLGYEWIYPIKTIDSEQKHMYFYRWADDGCFQDSAEKLAKEIADILNQNKSFKKVYLIGHSYGGVLVTHVLKNWQLTTPIEVHVVASPLSGTAMLNKICGYEPIKEIPINAILYEWRTQHRLDNAYKDLSKDPQAINIKGSLVTTLPDTYKGNRLGHNWSISWVADEFF